MAEKIKIGVTFSEARYENYPAWIQGNDPNIEIVELHWEKHDLEEVWDLVEDCDGIVLSGGVDIHPRFYENERLVFPNGDGKFNEERDEFEMHVFETALNFNLPVLAICRGLQVLNVAYGGTLHQHISDLEGLIAHVVPGGDGHGVVHDVTVEPGSMLADVCGTGPLQGSCHHHQAVAEVGSGLVVTARAADGVVEGLEVTGSPGAARHPSACGRR